MSINNNRKKKHEYNTQQICATYIQAGQDLRVPLWYRAPLDHPRNISDKAIEPETQNVKEKNTWFSFFDLFQKPNRENVHICDRGFPRF